MGKKEIQTREDFYENDGKLRLQIVPVNVFLLTKIPSVPVNKCEACHKCEKSLKM